MKLTDEQIRAAGKAADCGWLAGEYRMSMLAFARAIEAEVLRLNGGGGEAVAWLYTLLGHSGEIANREASTINWDERYQPFGRPGIDFHEDGVVRKDPLYAAPQPQQAAPSHASDCATHNAPAYPAGPCDCLPTPEMCRAAVEYMNGADVYEKVPPGVAEIEEGIYREVYLAMQRNAPQQAALEWKMPDAPDLFKFINSQPILQSLLYDINLLPECCQDGVQFNHMIAICNHFDMLIKQAAPGAVLEGWQLVPVKPTTEMIERMRDQNMAGSMDNWNAYISALAAAPKPQGE